MKYTLLIVEDDLDTSEMLRVYFEAQGYRVVTAAGGYEALEKCRRELPDLILLDVRLPDIDGFEVGQRLQEDIRTSRLPVIFVTEKRERDDRITGLRLGAIDYITKPFDVQELRLRVRNALRRAVSQYNPVTSLPGDKLTKDRLGMLLEKEDWAILTVKIMGLELFNEVYGFVARDDVLRAVALIITSAVDELGTIDDYVGHPTESRFVVVTTSHKVERLSTRISKRLNQAMVYFYPIQDREPEHMKEQGREGKSDIPFMQVSVHALSQKDGPFGTVESLQKELLSV